MSKYVYETGRETHKYLFIVTENSWEMCFVAMLKELPSLFFRNYLLALYFQIRSIILITIYLKSYFHSQQQCLPWRASHPCVERKVAYYCPTAPYSRKFPLRRTGQNLAKYRLKSTSISTIQKTSFGGFEISHQRILKRTPLPDCV